MRKHIALLLACALLALSPSGAARAEHTREEVRAAYAAISHWSTDSPYAERPVVEAPYAPGALTEAVRRDALNMLNFTRWLAGLDPVSESRIYDYQCQHGAVLLAALDIVDHNAPRPEDMDKNFYDSAHLATSGGNIAKFNWMRPSILREGIAYFLRDDGETNLPVLGHRRWALNPEMTATGFGLANSASGMSYVLMYAHDMGGEAEWSSVCWPAEGAFPATLMHADLAWSVTLNPTIYDLSASSPVVTMTEERSGLSFTLTPGGNEGFCAVSLEGYGAGPCITFRPDFAGTGFTDYQQNQRWQVKIEGLRGADGAPRPMDYDVTMISLDVQDAVNVELSPLEATLAPGDVLRLRADVIPAYADDLTVLWHSSDASVAAVDEIGRVTAVAPGECEITVTCAGGYEDRCRVVVR